MNIVNLAQSYSRAHRLRFLQLLKDFIRFPTISAQPEYRGHIKRCAAWLANHLAEIGLKNTRVIETEGHPIVYADWKYLKNAPTILIYGHYDVQPVDPLAEWKTPPFKPVTKNNNLYGRGASDDKGQLFTHVKALESYLKSSGRLPVNVIYLFEGEEEIGSPNLKRFIQRNKDLFPAQLAIVSDTRMLGPARPAITYSLRGNLNVELEIRGPKYDLHSGNFGGAIHNPLEALSEIIAKIHDRQGKITIPGFYDMVRHWDEEEHEYMQHAGPSNEEVLKNALVNKGHGENGFTLYERTTIRPSLIVTGIRGGYQGPGVKGIIPSRAIAKLNFRLVPDQDPVLINRLFRQYVAQVTPRSVQSVISTQASANPVTLDRNHPFIKIAAIAYYKGFGAEPVFIRSGGTIPVVNIFQETLNIPTVLMGFALPDDRMHAPNEKFHLPTFYKGIATSIWFLHRLGISRNNFQEFSRYPSRTYIKNHSVRNQEEVAYDY